MFQKYLLTYGSYDVGDIITMVRYSTSLEEALEDAQYLARTYFEGLGRKGKFDGNIISASSLKSIEIE